MTRGWPHELHKKIIARRERHAGCMRECIGTSLTVVVVVVVARKKDRGRERD